MTIDSGSHIKDDPIGQIDQEHEEGYHWYVTDDGLDEIDSVIYAHIEGIVHRNFRWFVKDLKWEALVIEEETADVQLSVYSALACVSKTARLSEIVGLLDKTELKVAASILRRLAEQMEEEAP